MIVDESEQCVVGIHCLAVIITKVAFIQSSLTTCVATTLLSHEFPRSQCPHLIFHLIFHFNHCRAVFGSEMGVSTAQAQQTMPAMAQTFGGE